MKRVRKVHQFIWDGKACVYRLPPCHTEGSAVKAGSADITCRICMFRYLAEQAPWAKDFLLDLKAADPKAKTSEGARRPRYTGDHSAD